MNEACRQLEEALQSQSGSHGDLHLNVFWNDSRVGHKQSRRFLVCVEDSLLMQVIDQPFGEILCWNNYPQSLKKWSKM